MNKIAKVTALSMAVCTVLTLGAAGAFAATGATANAAASTTHAAVHKKAAIHRHMRFLERPALVRDAAKWLQITPRQLRADLKSGQSVAQVAQAKGASATGLIAALTKDVDAHLQKLANAHHLSAKREQRLESKLGTKLQHFVEHQGRHAQASTGSRSAT